MSEVFVILKDYPNYSVSDLGKVVNTVTNKTLKPYPNNGNCLLVTLTVNGKTYRRPVHRLLAEAFLWYYDPDFEVEFINGDKNDIKLTNLQMTKRPVKRRAAKVPTKEKQ